MDSMDAIITRAERALEELDAALASRERFGKDDDYPADSVIYWTRSFGSNNYYTWVAIKIDTQSWYLTGAATEPTSFDKLVTAHLVHADEVWMASEWRRL